MRAGMNVLEVISTGNFQELLHWMKLLSALRGSFIMVFYLLV
jgi:hypothetical protein